MLNYIKSILFIVVVFSIVLLLPLVAGEQGQIIHAIEEEKELNRAPQSESEEEEQMFPKSMTVLNVNETTAVNIKELPADGSKSLGIVYGNLMHVDVIQNLENGYSEISTWDYASMKSIKGFVPTKFLKTVELDEKYGIMVALNQQKVYIYENDALIKTFLCSSGLDENNCFTPNGLYRIGERGQSFFSPKYGQGAYHWVRFNNNYLFHSVPFDEKQNIIEEEAAKLGQKASHGCIRLSMDDALWLYKNIPQGTPVIIKD